MFLVRRLNELEFVMIIGNFNHLKYNVIEYDSVDSTMIEVKKFPENSVVIAKRQENGKGKGDRVWDSSSNNNLYFSLCIATDEKRDYSQLSFLSSVAMRYAILKFKNSGSSLLSKWPNDVLINEKKVCGILLEHDCSNNILVIGIGVNIDYFPEGAMFKATSLKNEGIVTDKYSILREFLNNFDNLFNEWRLSGFSLIREKWLSDCYKLNQEIEVDCQRGVFDGIDKDGTLIMRLMDGSVKQIKSGDIFS